MAVFSDLPAEIRIQIYEELIANNRTTRYVETNRAFSSSTTFTPPGREPDTSGADLRTALQLDSTSREVALRHISRNSPGPVSTHLGLVLRHNFNPATDLVSFDPRWWQNQRRGIPPARRSAYAKGLVLGAEFPNVVLAFFDFESWSGHDGPDPTVPAQNPVTAAMQYLTDPTRTPPPVSDVFGWLEAPRMPRNLYITIGTSVEPEATGRIRIMSDGEPFVRPEPPKSIFTLEEYLTPEVDMSGLSVTLHMRVIHIKRHWDAWSQIPGLELPNLFFVCARTFDEWITEHPDGDYPYYLP